MLRLNTLFLIACCAIGTHQAEATEITPVGAKATSEFGAIDVFGTGDFSSVFIDNLIDGSGLEDFEGTPNLTLDDYHDNDPSSANGWHSGDFDAGLPGGTDNDDEPFTAPPVATQIIEFDLGGLHSLTHTHIWQQNQSNLFGESLSLQRGVDQFEILVSTAPSGASFTSLGDFNLDWEEGIEPVPAQAVRLPTNPDAWRVRFQLKTAYSELANEFVGLSEVRFEGKASGIPGDFNRDGLLTAIDIDLLSAEVRNMQHSPAFDLNADQQVDDADRTVWVEELKFTFFGDSNLDGQFDSTDFVAAFQAGKYEDKVVGNSNWSDGDWNGDGDFNSTDFVKAFQSGGYEAGPRSAAAKLIPEPSTALLAILGLLLLASRLGWRG
ncbi:MAG: hypothetical protein GY768_15350 [Planctomycetaceae bacterium]|nr:hypothetical protein [Planctomycetaceae bacterium]